MACSDPNCLHFQQRVIKCCSGNIICFPFTDSRRKKVIYSSKGPENDGNKHSFLGGMGGGNKHS